MIICRWTEADDDLNSEDMKFIVDLDSEENVWSTERRDDGTKATLSSLERMACIG